MLTIAGSFALSRKLPSNGPKAAVLPSTIGCHHDQGAHGTIMEQLWNKYGTTHGTIPWNNLKSKQDGIRRLAQ